MLQNLYVKNLALIDETEVEFGEGLNILTGETGAGKSILLGSVTLALGGKYNAQMLRNGAKSGLVELTFHIKEEKILKKLEALDIYPEDGYLTLSRRLLEGRSVSKINGETVNMSVLKDVASLLIDIHGQHDNQTLLHRKNHLTLLDLYGKEQTDPLKEKMASCYQEWKAVCKKVEQSSLDEESRRRELSLAEFEVNEIEEAALKEGEDELLEEQYRKMTDSRKLTEGVAEAYQYTAEDERGNASDYLSRAIRSLQEAASFDEKGSQLYDQIVEIDSLLNDFNRDLAEYAKSFEYSEEEFSEVESRLNEVNHLKAKYGNTVSDILAYCEEKRQRLSELEDYDSFMQELLEKQKKAEKQMEMAGEYPDVVIGCFGGGSNFSGITFPFLRHKLTEGKDVRVIAAEPASCPKLTRGQFQYDFGDEAGYTPLIPMFTLGHNFAPANIHAGGLRYHGAGSIVSQLMKDGLMSAYDVKQLDTFQAATMFAQAEGIIPAPESSHAIAVAIREALEAKEEGKARTILFNLSGHGLIDMAAYDQYLAGDLTNYEVTDEEVANNLSELEKIIK